MVSFGKKKKPNKKKSIMPWILGVFIILAVKKVAEENN